MSPSQLGHAPYQAPSNPLRGHKTRVRLQPRTKKPSGRVRLAGQSATGRNVPVQSFEICQANRLAGQAKIPRHRVANCRGRLPTKQSHLAKMLEFSDSQPIRATLQYSSQLLQSRARPWHPCHLPASGFQLFTNGQLDNCADKATSARCG